MDTARVEHNQEPAELAHHWLLVYYPDGDHEAFRVSGRAHQTAEMAVWLCRLIAKHGVAAVTYPGPEHEWPPTDAMDIAEDVASGDPE